MGRILTIIPVFRHRASYQHPSRQPGSFPGRIARRCLLLFAISSPRAGRFAKTASPRLGPSTAPFQRVQDNVLSGVARKIKLSGDQLHGTR
jgi:hypothetical protein